MVLLFSAPEIPHFEVYGTLLLFHTTILFNHISHTVNAIVVLYIKNKSKILYLSSLIFRKNRDVFTSVDFRDRNPDSNFQCVT